MINTRITQGTGLAELFMPRFRGAGVENADPVVAPTKDPEVVPTRPDVEPAREPNTVPHRDPVPEPHVDPCERPDTTCPVHE